MGRASEGRWLARAAPAAKGRTASQTLDRQKRQLRRKLKRGARRAGFATERWTLARVQQVIERDFGVSYHRNHLSRLLDGLDWSIQQPLPRAQEREEEVIRAWLAHDWLRIKKGAATWRRRRVL
jgi:transposase